MAALSVLCCFALIVVCLTLLASFFLPSSSLINMYCTCICSYVFKLADFGTARELRENETFISLHGTEEYLYPGMYERALVNPTKRHQFSAKVWCVSSCHGRTHTHTHIHLHTHVHIHVHTVIWCML